LVTGISDSIAFGVPTDPLKGGTAISQRRKRIASDLVKRRHQLTFMITNSSSESESNSGEAPANCPTGQH